MQVLPPLLTKYDRNYADIGVSETHQSNASQMADELANFFVQHQI